MGRVQEEAVLRSSSCPLPAGGFVGSDDFQAAVSDSVRGALSARKAHQSLGDQSLFWGSSRETWRITPLSDLEPPAPPGVEFIPHDVRPYHNSHR